jgi:uncharacterized membrane protein YfcA
MIVRDFFVFLLFFFDLLPYGGCFTLPPRPRCCRCAVAGGPPRAPPPQRKAPARARRRLTGGAAALPEVVIFSEALDPLGPAALTLGLGVGAVLGLLGGGGSILALPCFLYAFKEPPDVAMAESLAVVAIGALTGFLYKARPLPSAVPMEKSSTSFSSSSTATEEDRDCPGDAASPPSPSPSPPSSPPPTSLVDFDVAVPFAGVAATTSFATARVAGAVPEAVRLGLFGCFAVASAISMWDSSSPAAGSPSSASSSSSPSSAASLSVEEDDKADPSTTAPSEGESEEAEGVGVGVVGKRARLGLIASGVGALTALIGAGGGFVVVPALTVGGGVPVKRAVASALLVVATNAAVAFASFATLATTTTTTPAVADTATAIDIVATSSSTTVELHYGTLVPFAVAVAAGAVGGSVASERVNGAAVKRAFAAAVLALAAAVLGSKIAALLSLSV